MECQEDQGPCIKFNGTNCIRTENKRVNVVLGQDSKNVLLLLSHNTKLSLILAGVVS